MSFRTRRLYVQLPCQDGGTVVEAELVAVAGEQDLAPGVLRVNPCNNPWGSPRPHVALKVNPCNNPWGSPRPHEALKVNPCNNPWGSPRPDVEDAEALKVNPCNNPWGSPRPVVAELGVDDGELFVEARHLPLLKAALVLRRDEIAARLAEIDAAEHALTQCPPTEAAAGEEGEQGGHGEPA